MSHPHGGDPDSVLDMPTTMEVFQVAHQIATGGGPMPVHLDGPTETQELPAVGGSARTLPLPLDGTALRVLQFEPQRKRALLLAVDRAALVAFSQGEAGNGSGAILPVGAYLTLHTRDEVWVRPLDAGGAAARLSVLTEQWTR